MAPERYDLEEDPNYQAYLRLKEKEELPESRYLAIAEGELITSGDELEKVILNTADIDVNAIIIDTEKEPDGTFHIEGPGLARD